MAEEKKDAAEEGGKKKGGKMPLILGLVLGIGVGGFLFTKMGGSKKEEPAKPKIELGDVVPLEEFLVNLKDGRSYLRTKINLHLMKEFKVKEKFDPLLPAVRDAIILTLSNQTLKEVNSLAGKEDLKVELAQEVNEILDEGGPKVHAGKENRPKVKRPEKDKLEHPEWDSQTGPVLKVYFTDFATQ